MTRNQIFILLILGGLMTGSGFYVGHSLLKPSQIAPLLAIAILPFSIVRNRLRYDRLALWLALYVGLTGLYNIPALEKDQLIDFGFIVSTFLVYIAAFLSAKLVLKGDRFPLKVILFLFAGLFCLYIFQVTTGTNLVANSEERDFYSTTFNNINDISSVVIVFMPLIFYSLQRWKPSDLAIVSAYLLISGWIVIMGSRSCLIALVIVPLMLLIFSANYLWKLIILSFTGFMSVAISQLDWQSIIGSLAELENEIISRPASRVYLFLFDFSGDKSSSYRLDSYIYAIEHFGDTVFGLGTKNYGSFYKAGFGADTLVAYAPHSYFIENAIAFGWFGLFLIACMLLACLFAVLRDRRYQFYGLTTFLLFIVASFVPSTLIRLPIIWFPLFFFAQIATQHRAISDIEPDLALASDEISEDLEEAENEESDLIYI